ncbi:MAG: tetratricopeptide repeat protein [Acidobacteriota bacterium]
MKSQAWGLVLALAAAGALGSEPGAASKPAEPFYRKYLVPGNRLDDRILEQEGRVSASPSDASLRNDFGNLLAERRFPHQAAEQYEIAAKLDKTNFISLYNLGLLRETEGKESQAIRAYERSIDRKRGFPQSHFRLGRLYERTGRGGDAVREYAQAMQIDPSMRDAHRNPLVIDSELLYQASLANYARDVAAASMVKESVYVEESRFRAMPVDRALTSREASDQDETESHVEPRQIGTANAAGVAGGVETTAPSATGKRPAAAARPMPTDTDPLTGRVRAPAGLRRPTPSPRGGTPMIAAPPGTSLPPQPPPPEISPRPEPEPPPENVPEPPAPEPVEDEPS